MASREEIREGIACIFCGWRDACIDKRPITDNKPSGDTCSLQLQSADQSLTYLHSQDVVIKVERKEPFNCGHAQMAAARYSRDVTCPLIEAGCGFFEPLVKEV